MENHPIPQDITGFQFKLIGDMTIKQFAYLAVGMILGWIFFALPIFFLIKIPIAMLFMFLGIATAFFPVSGRSLDVVITNFLKDLFSPTQYVYQKTGGHIWFPQASNLPQETAQTAIQQASTADDKLRNFLKSLPQQPKNQLDQKETAFFQSLSPILGSIPIQQAPQIVTQGPSGDRLAGEKPREEKEMKQDEEEKQTDTEVLALKKKLSETKIKERTEIGTPSYAATHQKVLELEKFLQDVLSQKQALEERLLGLQKEIGIQKQNVYTPSTAQPKEETQNTRMIPRTMGKATGTPIFPDTPNLITGVVKDPRGNPLANILVEIKDHSGNPVRAFKTNALGQFASATPIISGVYTLLFEDPREQNKFDNIEINATGEIILPLEIISSDKREELRRSLFNDMGVK
ncbi:MAG: PrgI family protein [Patescibacteria group bacterium]|nr:PrgI family protein [Patescibacteria group bacterium]